MSLMIDVDRVTELLLADGWHQVHDQSFRLSAYEYGEANAGQPQGHVETMLTPKRR